jgi:hypothetical protein
MVGAEQQRADDQERYAGDQRQGEADHPQPE